MSSSFTIRVNLRQPEPPSFLFGLFVRLCWIFFFCQSKLLYKCDTSMVHLWDVAMMTNDKIV